MTFTDGLLLGIFGMLLTVVGLMIAYVVGTKTIKKKNAKEEPNALRDLFKK